MLRDASEVSGVVVLQTVAHRDDRGYLVETWREERCRAAGIDARFVQDNLSVSRRGVLRGLHFQHPAPQGKLVYVLQGSIWDVGVDLRRGSPTFGDHVAVELSAGNGLQVFLPEGMAHGFYVTSDSALVAYKCTATYQPGSDRGLRWDDPALGIAWPEGLRTLSPKDAALPLLTEISSEDLVEWT